MSGAAFVSLAALAEAAPAWRALCARGTPNPFAEPEFLLPLLAYERPRRLRFALVRGEDGGLLGFAALTLPRFGLARVWMSPYAALPAAALDPDAAREALLALVALLRGRGLAGLIWPYVEHGGPVAAALAGLDLPLRVVGRRKRAALRLSGAAAFEAGLEARRRKRWARQARRLAEKGRLEEASGAAAVEAFLAVERTGWKGARGTALADDPARLAFAREMLAAFAQAGRLEALSLTLDGAPIAAGLILIARTRAFYWKSAYDEGFAEASPGVQLAFAQSRRLVARSGLALADSCAAEDHPMIARVWGDVLAFEDIALGLRVNGERALRVWAAAAQAKAGARAAAKRWAQRLMGLARRK